MERVYIAVIAVLAVIIIYLISDIIVYKSIIKRQKDVLGNFVCKATGDLQLSLRREKLKIGGIYTSITGDKVEIVGAFVDYQGVLYILYIFTRYKVKDYDDDVYLCWPCEKFKSIFK